MPQSLRPMLLLVFALVACDVARAQVTVLVQPASRTTHRLGIAAPLQDAMRVRVLRQADLAPQPGVAVDFFVNVLLCFPLDPICEEPDFGLYGHFPGPDDVELLSARVTTDAQGYATAPPFRAGDVAGRYEVVASVSALHQVPPGSFTSSGGVGFSIIQSGIARPIPAGNPWVWGGLGAAMLLAAGCARRPQAQAAMGFGSRAEKTPPRAA